MTEKEAALSYSQMFKILTEFTGEIPLGIYRTDTETENSDVKVEVDDGTKRRKSMLDGLSFRNRSNKK